MTHADLQIRARDVDESLEEAAVLRLWTGSPECFEHLMALPPKRKIIQIHAEEIYITARPLFANI